MLKFVHVFVVQGASDGTASMSTRAGGWRTEAGAGLWSLSLLLLVLLSVLGC